jgi:hypothetical protein
VARPAGKDGAVSEQELEGGNAGRAVRIGDTVRRATRPWTPSVHSLLQHLDRVGFVQAPKLLGNDEHGREVLSLLPGNTVGTSRPWPAWVHSDDALIQVAHWLRDYHAAVADFVPSDDAVWREGGHWQPGLIIGQSDAAPYNAAWDDQGQVVGFFDWDVAAPVSQSGTSRSPRSPGSLCTPATSLRRRGSPTSVTGLDGSGSFSRSTAGQAT